MTQRILLMLMLLTFLNSCSFRGSKCREAKANTQKMLKSVERKPISKKTVKRMTACKKFR
jgi:hypothetical protein